MRIAIVAFDTRGGIEPYVALGAGLRAAGHDAVIVAPEDAATLVAGTGLPLATLTGSVAAFLATANGIAERGTLAAQRVASREMAGRIAGWTREALAACEGSDLVVGGIGGMVVALGPADKLGIPFVPAHLQPIGAPTTAYPGVLVGTPGWLGGPGRWVGHRLSELAFWMPFRGAMATARRDVLGLDGRARAAEGRPVLYGFSRHVVPVPPGRPERHVTGYWRLPPAADWQPPADLEAFLDAPGPVVSVGFGSMATRDPAALATLVVEAARRAGVRAVLVAGWSALDASAAADEVFPVAAVPYDWLFGRVAATVHHGGAGTTGEALRAGVPTVVVPFAVDQPFWASRVRALGVGPEPIPRRRLTAERLADALRTAVRDEPMRARAADLGARLRREDGVRAAVEVIGRLSG